MSPGTYLSLLGLQTKKLTLNFSFLDVICIFLMRGWAQSIMQTPVFLLQPFETFISVYYSEVRPFHGLMICLCIMTPDKRRKTVFLVSSSLCAILLKRVLYFSQTVAVFCHPTVV